MDEMVLFHFEMYVRHCQMLSMLADFFTKPLNFSLFRKFRDVILEYKPICSLREISAPQMLRSMLEIMISNS